MDPLQTRLDALEQRTHTVERQLRWWRGLACGLLGLAVLTWALLGSLATDGAGGGQKGLEQRVAALESVLKHFSRQGHEVTMTGANLHLVNGLGSTDCTDDEFNPIPDCLNGLGNLIAGYNELRGDDDGRTGSHNAVVGQHHNFFRFGGLVVGDFNTISGDFAAVTGGQFNTASGQSAVVSAGGSNTASGLLASVCGGGNDPALGAGNTASGFLASVCGGFQNIASGEAASVCGGGSSTASGILSAVSGGSQNTAIGVGATVGGGQKRTATGEFDWVAGNLFEDD